MTNINVPRISIVPTAAMVVADRTLIELAMRNPAVRVNCILPTPAGGKYRQIMVDIDSAKLPPADEVRGWTSQQFVSALRHVERDSAYNPSLRQLLHVGFKVAAKMGPRYLNLLNANEAVIAKNVTENLYDRHIAPVFLGRAI